MSDFLLQRRGEIRIQDVKVPHAGTSRSSVTITVRTMVPLSLNASSGRASQYPQHERQVGSERRDQQVAARLVVA